jgi:hypothetical protein
MMLSTTAHRSWRNQAEARWRAAVSATMMMNRSTPPPPPYYNDLLALADDLFKEGRYELAVVVAQMACEVVVEQTLTPLLKGKKRPKNFNLEGGALGVYTRLTTDQITKKPFWKPFIRHAKRRHDVIHFGGRVLSFAKTSSGSQVVDQSALMRPSFQLDGLSPTPPASASPLPLGRPPPVGPRESGLASAARRVQTNGDPAAAPQK